MKLSPCSSISEQFTPPFLLGEEDKEMEEEIKINKLEEDIFREIINIGLAKVADSFSVIARQTVLLNVPAIKVADEEHVNSLLPPSEREDFVILSDIDGEINGKTFVIFEQDNARKLAEVCIGSEQGFQGNYLALKKSLLLEVSNILTGSLATQLANIFDLYIHGQPPVFVPYAMRHSFRNLVADLVIYKPVILTVKTEFLNSRNTVEMPMVLLFDLLSMQKIRKVIKKKQAAGEGLLTL
jgi:chemotaxis protein CheC